MTEAAQPMLRGRSTTSTDNLPLNFLEKFLNSARTRFVFFMTLTIAKMVSDDLITSKFPASEVSVSWSIFGLLNAKKTKWESMMASSLKNGF